MSQLFRNVRILFEIFLKKFSRKVQITATHATFLVNLTIRLFCCTEIVNKDSISKKKKLNRKLGEIKIIKCKIRKNKKSKIRKGKY